MSASLPLSGRVLPEPVPLLLRDLVHERTGIYFESDRVGTLLEKLEPRLAATSCASYLDYYYLLKYDDGRAGEWLRVMDAFSVPETYFWREVDQIEALVRDVVPAWFARTPDRPLRIWSAACASGEEPYSILIALHEAGWGAHPIEVRASDASETAIARARTAVYRERSFRALPPHLRTRYFREVDKGHQLDSGIAAQVTFRRANLVVPDELAGLVEADVIFCRNVFIYFSPAAIARVVGSFAAAAHPGHHLFIGASESLLKITEAYELAELGRAFVYRHKEAP